jgi:lipid-binding SYLF domain-containing protein
MQRRDFLQLAVLGTGGIALVGCQGDRTTEEKATIRREIDAGVGPTLDKMYADVRGSREAAGKSEAMLVFPSVTKAGVGIGGEFGRGALRRGMRTDGYYAFSSGSIGFQLGAEKRSIVIMFMTQDALKKFLDSSGWSVGADASYAVPEQGGAAQAATTPKPVVIYIFGATGLMFNASVEGSKIEKLDLT